MRCALYLLFIACCYSATATNWYVDNALGTGSNNGTSWANAWRSLAAISWAGINPGDTVYISGGSTSQTYQEVITSGKDGTAGNLITVTPGVDAGHNGKVVIDGQNTRTYGVQMNNYWKLSGGAATNLVFTNYVSSTTDRDTTGGAAIWGGSHCIIEFIEIGTAMNGVYCSTLNDVEIRNCYMHDIRGDYGVRVNGYQGSDFTNYRVHNCYMLLNEDLTNQPSGGGPDGVQCQDGLTMYSNIIRSVSGPIVAGQHPDGVQAMGSYHKIYDNYFANQLNSGAKPGPIIGLGYTVWQETYVFNNVFVQDTSPLPGTSATYDVERGTEAMPDSVTVPSVTNVFIVNNTLVDVNLLGVIAGTGSASSVKNFVVANNITFNTGRNSGGSYVMYVDANGVTSGVTVDYNLNNAGSDGSSGGIWFNGTNPYTQSHPRSSAPLFVLYNKRGTGSNFRLQSGDTAALGNGTNFYGVISEMNYDADGNARPSVGNWNIGAFGSTNSVASTSASTTLGTGTVIQANGKMIFSQ